MAKLVVAVALCSLFGLVVGIGQMVGAPIPAGVNEECVQRALVYAMQQYNKGTNDMYLSKVMEVTSAKKQVVSGYNIMIQAVISRTMCKKPMTDYAQCAVHTEPHLAQTLTCEFTVYVVPWTGERKLTKQECGNGDFQ
uniref:Cystatin domain-containing protein n=1 Tax=Leptobrachium leishanense TaxID=445787 RepID=A0A8C5M7I5_9ANUR